MTLTQSSMSAVAASWPAEQDLDFFLDDELDMRCLSDLSAPVSLQMDAAGLSTSFVGSGPGDGAELDSLMWPDATSAAASASQPEDGAASSSAREGTSGPGDGAQVSAAQQIAATARGGVHAQPRQAVAQTEAATVGSLGRAPRRRTADGQQKGKGTVRTWILFTILLQIIWFFWFFKKIK